MGLVGLDTEDRDQRQADIANLLEQAVQGSLIGYRAMDDGGAIAPVGETQPVKPGGPSGIEVPLEADLVSPALLSIGVVRSAHLLLSAGLAIRGRRGHETRSACG
jgi:hypothetical protein